MEKGDSADKGCYILSKSVVFRRLNVHCRQWAKRESLTFT